MHSSSRCKNRTGRNTTVSHVRQYRAENGNLRKSGSTFRHGTVFAQSNVDIKRKLQVWRVQKCIPLVGAKTALTCAGRQTSLSHVSQYRAKNGNLRKSQSTFRHGTMLEPKQCLYQQEATGMEIPKLHCSSRCKNRTYLCGTANYPISCKPVYGQERKFQEIHVYLSPWYRVCTKVIFISKGSYRYAESKNAFL